MSETLHGLETQMREAQIRRATANYARHGRTTPPAAPTRHRLAERLRRMAERLDG
jgi:hypothetical protein